MDYSDIHVNQISLRSVVQGGHSKCPLHLLKKLIPLVFMTEELGGLCGQGIGKANKSGNPNDSKRPLDQHKVNVCKGRHFTVISSRQHVKKRNSKLKTDVNVITQTTIDC